MPGSKRSSSMIKKRKKLDQSNLDDQTRSLGLPFLCLPHSNFSQAMTRMSSNLLTAPSPLIAFPLFPDRLTLLPLIISVCSWAQAQTLAPIIPYSTHVKGLTPTHIPYNHSQKARNFIQWPSDPRKSGQHHQHLVLLFLEDGMTESRNYLIE